MADDRLELRPNWSVVALLLLCGGMCLLIAATTFFTSVDAPGAGFVMGMAALLGVLAVGMAERMRLILTDEGFRYRVMWRGRFVPWNEVRRFEPDVPPLGVYWVPIAHLPMPESAWQWWVAMSAAQGRHLPLFGVSRKYMVETLNSWLESHA